MHRIDLDKDRLIVKYPTDGHEFLLEIFRKLGSAGSSFPDEYQGSKIRAGGSSDIYIYDDVKSPDYSLYERHGKFSKTTRRYPTIVWEVAYSESRRKLAEDAARLLCLSGGRVLLVVAIDIRASPAPARKLESMTWAFWEVTNKVELKAASDWRYEYGKVFPTPGGCKPPTSFQAALKNSRGLRYVYTADQVKTFDVRLRLSFATRF